MTKTKNKTVCLFILNIHNLRNILLQVEEFLGQLLPSLITLLQNTNKVLFLQTSFLLSCFQYFRWSLRAELFVFASFFTTPIVQGKEGSATFCSNFATNQEPRIFANIFLWRWQSVKHLNPVLHKNVLKYSQTWSILDLYPRYALLSQTSHWLLGEPSSNFFSRFFMCGHFISSRYLKKIQDQKVFRCAK